MKTLMTHCLPLSGSHTLAQPHLPRETIEEYYSVCGRPHGHLYRLEITHDLSAVPKEETHALFLKNKSAIEAFVNEKISGKDLNEMFGNTAGEALCPSLFEMLKTQNFGRWITQIALQETAKNRFVSSERNFDVG
jgi:hypothetical protein